MVQAWCINGTLLVQKTRSNIGAYSPLHGANHGTLLVHIWCIDGAYFVKSWFKFGTLMAQIWSKFGLNLVHIDGTYLVKIWFKCGALMV